MHAAVSPKVLVWDRLVRSTHWFTAFVVLANLTVLEAGEKPHRWLGYAACAAVALRTVWGVVGSRHARFADWFPTPGRLIPYVKLLLKGEEPRQLGHNPLGAVMMLLLWALVLSLGITGYMMGTDAYFGEEWLQELHEVVANALWLALGLHVLGAVFESWRHKENLVASMINGHKRSE